MQRFPSVSQHGQSAAVMAQELHRLNYPANKEAIKNEYKGVLLLGVSYPCRRFSSCSYSTLLFQTRCKWVGRMRLGTETVKGSALSLEGVDDVEGGDGLPLGVLGVGDGVTDDVLKANQRYQGCAR